MEIQADYHRKSLSSLDTALAELKENHSLAGGDPRTLAPFWSQGGAPRRDGSCGAQVERGGAGLVGMHRMEAGEGNWGDIMGMY